MAAEQGGGRSLEIDVVRSHRLIISCSGSDFQRLLEFAEGPGFEVMSVISPCRHYTGSRGLALTATDRKMIQADKEDRRNRTEDGEKELP